MPEFDQSPTGGDIGTTSTSLDDELDLFRPEPYFDQQFDAFNGEFFDMMQMQLNQDWVDSGYGTSSVTDSLSPAMEKDKPAPAGGFESFSDALLH
jgi:hypothetical protein